MVGSEETAAGTTVSDVKLVVGCSFGGGGFDI